MPFTLSSPISPEGSHNAFDARRTSHGTATGTGTSMSLDSNHSPLASVDGHKGPHPIAMRDMRGEFKLIPDSDQAYHGSAAPSLIKKGDYFGAKQDQTPTLHQLPEEGDDSMNSEASSPVSPARTVTVHSNRPEVQDRRVVIVDISALQPLIEAGSGEAPMGFADAVKEIKRAGHPVHVLTAAPAAGDAVVREWLQAMDLSVGFGSDNDVAALWHVPDGDESAKIGVVRAINAALFCAPAKHSDIALAKIAKEGDLECCFAVQSDMDGDTAMGTTEGHFTPLSGPSPLERTPIRSVQGWMGVGAALAECKLDAFRLDKQKRD